MPPGGRSRRRSSEAIGAAPDCLAKIFRLGGAAPGQYWLSAGHLRPSAARRTPPRVPKVTMSADIEVIVVGAGVVGLAVAQAMAKAGREVMVLEQHELIGSETSSRNSEVIHAGIYYPPGSLRARLCVRGKQLLYQFCAESRVPHARCGKLLVETKESKLSMMAAIGEAAETNGEADLDVFY